MNEEWRPIPGFDNAYEISNFGRVRSLDRERLCKNRYGGFSLRKDKGKMITPTGNGNGYLIVGLRKNGKRENKYVHRLVAEAFYKNPKSLSVVNHLNFNKLDNRATNLEWSTQRENVRYSSERMRKRKSKSKPTNTGEKYISRRIRKSGAIRYRVFNKTFLSIQDAINYRNEVVANGA